MELIPVTHELSIPESNGLDLTATSSKQPDSGNIVQIVKGHIPFSGFSLARSTSFSEENDTYQQHPLSEHTIAVVMPAISGPVTAEPSKAQEKEVPAISKKEALQHHQKVIDRYKQFAFECRKKAAQKGLPSKKVQELLTDALRADLRRTQKEAVNQAASPQERYYFQSAARCYEKIFYQKIGVSENAITSNEAAFAANLEKAAKHYEAAADVFRFIKREDDEARKYLEIAREAEAAAISQPSDLMPLN